MSIRWSGGRVCEAMGMNILVTGAAGFVGRNLTENLKNIRDGKNRTRPAIVIDEIFEYDLGCRETQLEDWCGRADFVFHLAGVNRPKDPADFMKGNCELTAGLLAGLKKQGNTCPVMFASSLQASLAGRFGVSDYGLSKREAEQLFFDYAAETGAKAYVYRFPNLAGKWARPGYNSAVATFCHQVANDLPVSLNDPAVVLELLFIDDLMEAMYDVLEGHPVRCDYPGPGEVIDGIGYDGLTPCRRAAGRFCLAPVTHRVTLGRIVEWLHIFHEQPASLIMPAIPEGSFEKKLYAMYLSYLPAGKAVFDLKMNCDDRGSFTELLKTADHGQFSVNITGPGITKGQHWHNSKWELFIVVSGHGLIRERRIGTDPKTGLPYEPLNFEVSGQKIQAVHMLPGYTHSITNLSETEDLVTLMWASEIFDPDHPDTFYENV